jgi:hypothetical protein
MLTVMTTRFGTLHQVRAFVDGTAEVEFSVPSGAERLACIAETLAQIAYWRLSRRDKVLATPDPPALVTLLAEDELARAGLRPGVAITVAHTPSHRGAMVLAVRRPAEGAVSIPLLLERMPPAMREQLTVLETFPERFSLACLASARPDADLRQRLRTLLLAFPDSPQGQSLVGSGPRLQYFLLDEQGMQIYASMLPTLLERIPQTSAK